MYRWRGLVTAVSVFIIVCALFAAALLILAEIDIVSPISVLLFGQFAGPVFVVGLFISAVVGWMRAKEQSHSKVAPLLWAVAVLIILYSAYSAYVVIQSTKQKSADALKNFDQQKADYLKQMEAAGR